jgi:hypothetical protein
VWNKSDAGTAEMFDTENKARKSFFSKISCAMDKIMSSEERRIQFKQFASEYYNDDAW